MTLWKMERSKKQTENCPKVSQGGPKNKDSNKLLPFLHWAQKDDWESETGRMPKWIGASAE